MLDRQIAVLRACEAESSMLMATDADLVDADILSQCGGELVAGASAIEGAHAGAWRQLGSRSMNGVIGDASTASAAKGFRLLEASAEAVAGALMEPRF